MKIELVTRTVPNTAGPPAESIIGIRIDGHTFFGIPQDSEVRVKATAGGFQTVVVELIADQVRYIDESET